RHRALRERLANEARPVGPAAGKSGKEPAWPDVAAVGGQAGDFELPRAVGEPRVATDQLSKLHRHSWAPQCGGGAPIWASIVPLLGHAVGRRSVPAAANSGRTQRGP